MLVLSRKTGERVLIGDNVSVTIVRIGPNIVRLGIDAPNGINIVREEIVDDYGDGGPTRRDLGLSGSGADAA